MRFGTLIRDDSTDEGTFGVLTLDTGLVLQSGELPWRDLNADNVGDSQISCIPPDIYTCVWELSHRHGWCYHLQNVLHRTGIEIHLANWVGDKSKGLRCELLGCIALGTERGLLFNQKALLHSGDAIKKFNENLNKENLQLRIGVKP